MFIKIDRYNFFPYIYTLRFFLKLRELQSNFLKYKFVKRPSYKKFLLMVIIWICFSIIVALIYDPIKDVNPLWWLNTFLVIDGMIVCLILPYRSIFRYIIWYVYLSMIFATFMLGLIFINVVYSYINGELSMLYTYENAMLEPLLVLIQEINNSLNSVAQCAPPGDAAASATRAGASASTNVASQHNNTGTQSVLSALVNGAVNGAAIGSAAVAIGVSEPSG